MQVIPLGERYYFLVSTEKNVSASTKNAYLQGGAGYLLTYGGKKYAVYSVYDSLGQAEKSMENLQKREVGVKTLAVEVKNIYLKGEKKGEKAKIESVIQVFKGNIQFLHDLSKGAEEGYYTQNQLKDCLRVVEISLNAVKNRHTNEAKKKVSAMREDIVYARDIRFLEALLCDGLQKFCAKFPISFG
jgi:uncharacterized protein YhaN